MTPKEQFLKLYPQARPHRVYTPDGSPPSKWSIYRHSLIEVGSRLCQTQAKAWEDAWSLVKFHLPSQDEDVQAFVEATLKPTAAKYEKSSLHWIHGADEGQTFCAECASKEIHRLQKSDPTGEYLFAGGWPAEEDTPAFCQTCNLPLECNYTKAACEYELDHYEENGFNIYNPSDCDSYLEMVNTLGGYDGEPEDSAHHRLHILTRQIYIKLKRQAKPTNCADNA